MLGWNDGGALSDRVRTRRLGCVQRVCGRSPGLRAGFDTRSSRKCDRSHASRISRCASTGGTARGGPSRQGVKRDGRSCSAEGEPRDRCSVSGAPHERAQGCELSSKRSPWRTSTEGRSEVGADPEISVQLQSTNAQTSPKTRERQKPESKTNQQLSQPCEICKTSIPGSNPGGASNLRFMNARGGCPAVAR